jgi:DNA-binding NarL/FixJ family response regulator
MVSTPDMTEAMTGGWRMAIVDDHGLFTDALRAWAAENLPEVDVVYAGPDPAGVPAGTELVLLDIDLGEGARSADAVTAELVAGGSTVLLVSAIGDPVRVRPALAAGAIGYVPKKAGTDVLETAIRSARAGEVPLSPDLAAVMMSSAGRPELSRQEEMALKLYASGLKLEAVARRMGISPHTVREYLARVRRKYAEVGREVRTKTDLYAAAVRDGLLPREE